MLKRLGLMLCVIALAIATFAVSAAAAAAATVHKVKMGTDNGQLKFVPSELTIRKGDTIEFVNNKMAPHNAMIQGHAELSHNELLYKLGKSYETTFNEAGEYSLFCQPHRGAGMVGKITVQ